MPDDENSEGVIVDDDGALTLGRNEARSFALWIANMDEGTVSKLDSRTGAETGRYPTVGAMAPAGSRPWNEACNWSNLGNCPSRTAVDQNFDAYVANRAFGNQGTLTKYANREEDCVDRNGNGMIDTSRDLNANGIIDMGTAEFVGLDDECILYTVPTGGGNGVPRALAVGIAPPDALVGDVWVGLFNAQQACRYNPADGSLIGCLDATAFSGFRPYGMAADSMGRIWAVDRSGGRRDILGYIDSTTMTFTVVAPLPAASSCAVPYGVTVDGAGDIFMANQCDPSIWRYRPSTSEWTPVDAVAFAGSTRGVAADESNLWVALSHNADGFTGGSSNRIRQYRLSDLAFIAEHRMPTGQTPIGIGVSFDNSVWAICNTNNIAARLDPATGTWTEHLVGLPSLHLQRLHRLRPERLRRAAGALPLRGGGLRGRHQHLDGVRVPSRGPARDLGGGVGARRRHARRPRRRGVDRPLHRQPGRLHDAAGGPCRSASSSRWSSASRQWTA